MGDGTALAADSIGAAYRMEGHMKDKTNMKDKTSDELKGEGKFDEVKGKVKEEGGKLAGDRSTEIGGKFDQAKGKVKQGIGDLKEDRPVHDEPVDR
jgi:uncharacterized protein YjbJ (UPF0337 family)